MLVHADIVRLETYNSVDGYDLTEDNTVLSG